MAELSISLWSLFPQMFSTLFGFLLGLFSDQFKSLLIKAKPSCRFGNGADLRGITNKEDGDYLYLRGLISNSSRARAKNLKVFLVRIEKEETLDKFTRIDYNDYLQLRWSAVPEGDRNTGRDIPKGVSACFDLIRTESKANNIGLCTTYFPRRYAQLFDKSTRYRFKVCVVCDNANPRYFDVTLNRGPRWDQISVCE